MKTGLLTTEFWLTLVGSVVAVVVALNYISADQGQQVTSAAGEVIKALAGLVAVLAPILGPIFYSISRAIVKFAFHRNGG